MGGFTYKAFLKDHRNGSAMSEVSRETLDRPMYILESPNDIPSKIRYENSFPSVVS